MIVTINTDASFHPKYKVGAYAFWIVCDKGRIQRSGPLRMADNSLEAELKAIANAVHTLRCSDIRGIHKIIINCDCVKAFCRVSITNPDPVGRHIATMLNEIKSANGVKGKKKKIHEFRHVKAHVKQIEDARTWVNDWCDTEAKKQLWIKIKAENKLE